MQSGMLLRTELGLLLDKLDVPENRRIDLAWLQRNLALRNSDRAEYSRASQIVSQLLFAQREKQAKSLGLK